MKRVVWLILFTCIVSQTRAQEQIIPVIVDADQVGYSKEKQEVILYDQDKYFS